MRKKKVQNTVPKSLIEDLER